MIYLQWSDTQDLVCNPLTGTRCMIGGVDYGSYLPDVEYRGVKVGDRHTYHNNQTESYQVKGFVIDVSGEIVAITTGPYGDGWERLNYILSDKCKIL